MSLSSVIRYINAIDTTATDGSGKTGLAYSDFTAKYLVEGGTLTSLTTETITTLGTYQAPTSASYIRIKELANTDPTKGIYEVHFHDTQVASSGKNLWLFLSATGAKVHALWVPLADLSGRLPSALSSNGNIKSDLREVIGSTSGIQAFSYAIQCIGYGTANTGASTTSLPIKTLNATLADSNQLIGRIVIFPNGVGNSKNLQATRITASTTTTLTVEALSFTPAENDLFIIQ